MKGLEDKIREMIKAHAQEMRLGDKRAEQFYNALYAGTGLPIFAQVGLIDTGGDHELYLKCNENLTADRILNLVVGDAARTITLSGNPTLGDWFDQSLKQAASPTFVTTKLTALTDGYIPYHVSDAAGLANSGIFWDSGNSKVGIGTVAPGEKLEVYASGADIAIKIHEDAGSHDALLHIRRGTIDWGMRVINGGILQFDREAAHRMTLDALGDLFIEGLKTASTHPANYKAVYVNTDTGELYRLA